MNFGGVCKDFWRNRPKFKTPVYQFILWPDLIKFCVDSAIVCPPPTYFSESLKLLWPDSKGVAKCTHFIRLRVNKCGAQRCTYFLGLLNCCTFYRPHFQKESSLPAPSEACLHFIQIKRAWRAMLHILFAVGSINVVRNGHFFFGGPQNCCTFYRPHFQKESSLPHSFEVYTFYRPHFPKRVFVASIS